MLLSLMLLPVTLLSLALLSLTLLSLALLPVTILSLMLLPVTLLSLALLPVTVLSLALLPVTVLSLALLPVTLLSLALLPLTPVCVTGPLAKCSCTALMVGLWTIANRFNDHPSVPTTHLCRYSNTQPLITHIVLQHQSHSAHRRSHSNWSSRTLILQLEPSHSNWSSRTPTGAHAVVVAAPESAL